MNPLRKIAGFGKRVRWLAPVMERRYFAATVFLLKARRDQSHAASGVYASRPFRFRGTDLNAVKEVLIDKEYSFLTPMLGATQVPVILDVGAHIGLFALWVLSEKPDAKVFSLEASPRTFAILQDNRKACGGAWSIAHKAAWRTGESVSFSDTGVSMSHKVAAAGKVKVEGISLKDAVVWAGGAVDIAKIDIEGSEETFICSDLTALTGVKALVIELHPNLCNAARVEEAIRREFSRVKSIEGRVSRKPLLLCTR